MFVVLEKVESKFQKANWKYTAVAQIRTQDVPKHSHGQRGLKGGKNFFFFLQKSLMKVKSVNFRMAQI